jgi:hypothetical protein
MWTSFWCEASTWPLSRWWSPERGDCKFFRKWKEHVVVLEVAELALQLHFVKLFVAILKKLNK